MQQRGSITSRLRRPRETREERALRELRRDVERGWSGGCVCPLCCDRDAVELGKLPREVYDLRVRAAAQRGERHRGTYFSGHRG